MTNVDALVLPPESPLADAIRRAATGRRMVCFAGLPGVGKSLLVQQAALLARRAGRTVHLLQWDVARLPYDDPAVLARYPETGGITHAAVRASVSTWARAAVARWAQTHGPDHVLVAETPLVGHRFSTLAHRAADGAEAFLASEEVAWLVPVPTVEVRRAVEVARAREMAAPAHDHERGNAPAPIVQQLMDELYGVAGALGLGPAVGGGAGGYDPALYGAVYVTVLRHRHASVLPVEVVLPVRGSVYDLPEAGGVHVLAPTPAEMWASLDATEARFRGDHAALGALCDRWYAS